ncbi:emerin homolog 1-like isoform X2 [Haliotis rufescens]|uniref:emerin homolog 1-like isoform X2 n=1 Tax=Haliotis rufescens TaxID=6454 RepID=UPI00201EAA10|nr:emerin homolog 1-like isoform X2 [Haliotis rufescens]
MTQLFLQTNNKQKIPPILSRMAPTDNIATLSDRELSEKLRQYGVNVGPIVKSTRGLYEKKLRKFVLGQVSKPKYEEVPDDDEDDEDDEEEEEEEEKYQEKPAPVRPTRNEPRRRVPPMPATPPRGKPVQLEERVTTTTSRQTRTAPPPTTKPKSKGFPVWIILLVILILVGLGYLILQNMESAGESNIPREIESETV